MFNYCPPKKLDNLESKTFEDGKRYYTLPDGTRFPSVTTVLGATKKSSIMEWRRRVGEEEANRVSRKAASRGTNVHTLCEQYLNNEPLGNIMPDAKEMFYSIKPLLNNINNIHYLEQTLWSEQLGVAGRVDCIAEYNGILSVIDFKNSNRFKSREDIEDYFWQCTAYALMYEERIGVPINNLVVIMAVENERPLVYEESTQDHIQGLVKSIKFYKDNL